MLVDPQQDAPTRVMTDASSLAVFQELADSDWVPVAFFSHKCKHVETCYSTFGCELLADIFVTYLKGVNFMS